MKGTLNMSKHHIEKITCPNCKTESEFVLWDSINTQLDPEMKEKVRTGEVFAFECPNCKQQLNVDYATLYHQMEDYVMIYYAPGDPAGAVEVMKKLTTLEGDENKDSGLKLPDDYVKRVVATQNELREKLNILDEGLDDHVIELMKLFMMSNLQSDDPDMKIEEFLFDVDRDGKRFFAVHLAGGKWGNTDFHQNMYDIIAEKSSDEFKNDDALVVDLNWALGFIRKDENRRKGDEK